MDLQFRFCRSSNYLQIYTSRPSSMGVASLGAEGAFALAIGAFIMVVYFTHMDPVYNLIPGAAVAGLGLMMLSSAGTQQFHGKNYGGPVGAQPTGMAKWPNNDDM